MQHELAHRITQGIKLRIENHELSEHPYQWYVTDYIIDCDPGQFWTVVEQALIDMPVGD